MKPWSVEECESYAKQLRNKTRANTAEHAAQAIEYLLGLLKREEPVAWRWENEGKDNLLNKYTYLDNGAPDYPEECEPLYTTPPQREWVGLTDEEIIKCFDSVAFGQVEDDLIINKHVNIFTAIRGIEAKLKEKNSGS